MKVRIGSIIGWICACLVAALNIFAGIMKFVPMAPDSEGAKMMMQLGVSPTLDHVLGVVELAIVVLYLVPRTSTVGFVLMVGYFGGVLATMLTHAQDSTFIFIVFAVMTLGAYFRNPELLSRLLKKPVKI